MTSLNPLHTIEKQLGESLALHQGLTGAAGPRPHPRPPDPGRHPRPRGAARRLPAPALRRPAPAGDDRHGAGQRPRHPDRRRADHRARRDHPGPDPRPARRGAEGRGHGDAVHHPQPRHRPPHRRPRRGDAGRRDRRDRPDRADLRRPRASLHPRSSSPPSPPAGPTRCPPTPPPSSRPTTSASGSRSSRGLLRRTVGHIKAVNDATVAIRAGETLGVVGESGSGKTTLALAIMRLISSEGRIVFLGQDIQGWKHRELRRLRRDMQMVFQDPYGSLSPRMSVEQIVAEGLGVHGLGDEAGRVAAILRGGRPRPRDRRPLPARVLRRPAPAHRHRPRDDPAAEARRPRRADLAPST